MRHTVTARDGRIRLGVEDPTEAALVGVALILGTRRGSVPLYRDFGISWDFVDRNVQTAKAVLFAAVREQVLRYVEGAELVGLDFRVDPEEPGAMYPVAEVEIP